MSSVPDLVRSNSYVVIHCNVYKLLIHSTADLQSHFEQVIFEVLKYLERDDLPRCRAVSKRLHALITPVFADRLDEFQVILDPKPGFDEILCQLFLEEQDASRLKYSNFFFRDIWT